MQPATDRLDAEHTCAVEHDAEAQPPSYGGLQAARPDERRQGAHSAEDRAWDDPRVRRQRQPGVGQRLADCLQAFVPAEPLVGSQVGREQGGR